MNGSASSDIKGRIADVRAKLPIADVIDHHVKLSGTRGAKNRRGKCPFHGSNSASLAVYPDRAFCFGCQWGGDVIGFIRDHFGLSFIDALEDCEKLAGISAGETRSGAPAPVSRARNPATRRARTREYIEPIEMARAIWRRARPDQSAVRRYFMGRGIPASVLTTTVLNVFSYLPECPVSPWEIGGEMRGQLVAPAIMAMVRVPKMLDCADGVQRLEFVPAGLHVTYLNPGGDATMVRRKPWAKKDDPDPMLPKRRMLGPVGSGAVLLGPYRADAHLWVGEGNETVLSAMVLGDVDPAQGLGVAVLSLDNLQGGMAMWKNRTWPLHAVRPDPANTPFLIPGHRGPVTGLIDSDMKPLRGQRDRQTREFQGESVVERKGGPIVRRPITGAERADICGQLFVKAWRGAGASPVDAIRAPAGMDFNDALRAQGVMA